MQTNTATIGSLAPNTAYTAYVIAISEHGSSLPSYTVTAFTSQDGPMIPGSNETLLGTFSSSRPEGLQISEFLKYQNWFGRGRKCDSEYQCAKHVICTIFNMLKPCSHVPTTKFGPSKF